MAQDKKIMKIKLIIFIIIISLISCQKQLSQESKYISSSENSNENIEVFNNKKAENINIDNSYLDNFFNKNEYKIFDRPLNFNDKKIYFAVHYINSPMGIWDKLLGFEIKDNNINRILVYEDYKFINSNSGVFMDFSPEKYPGIYGFRFDYPENETFPGLRLSGYFNEGNRVADDFAIIWDDEKEGFKEYIPNFEY